MDRLDVNNIQKTSWDAIIIGAGIGGGAAALALGQAGLKVLVLEKGQLSYKVPKAQGIYAEQSSEIRDLKRDSKKLIQWGRYSSSLYTQSKEFIPFIGEGVGGSSALYGMAMEPFDKEDFMPSQKHQRSQQSLEDWPFAFDEIKKNYDLTQKIFAVHGESPLLKAPEFSPPNLEIYNYLKKQDMSPYQLPMACGYVDNCNECQGHICAKKCKKDSYTSCLEPAIQKYDVKLLEACEVVQLVSKGDGIEEMKAIYEGQEINLHADLIILASGAISTPCLLLKSDNLANSSGQVGKNLMRHLIDIYAIKTQEKVEPGQLTKQIAFRNLVAEELPLAYVHSFGRLPPAEVIELSLLEEFNGLGKRLMKSIAPLVQKFYINSFYSRTLLATILEDLPYEQNCLNLKKMGSTFLLQINYQVMEYEKLRVQKTRKKMKELFKDYPVDVLKEADNNKRIAHVCGTCKMGEDPKANVLRSDNRSHDIKNLYILDSSFFPSSSSYSPSLTISANAFRACKIITKSEFNYEELQGELHAS